MKEVKMTNQERKGPWVLLDLDRWPVIGPLVKKDQERFLKKQAKGMGPERRAPKIKESPNQERPT
jgi:hypothetical protein